MMCPLCESDHCWQVGMDETQGCCLCYNILVLEGIYSGNCITVCDDCYIHAKIDGAAAA